MSVDTTASTSSPHRLLRATTIIMLAFVASRILGLVREAVIGAQFGALDVYGAYIAAFRLPDLIFNLVAGGALASAFLPTFTEYLTADDHEGGWRLASAVANWLLLTLGAISIVAAIFAPWLVANIIAPGFDAELVRLTAGLMRLMLVSTLIFSVSGLIMSVLNAYEHFTMPAIAPVMYNLGILFGAIVLAPRMGIYGLAIGVVLGASTHALVQVPVLRRYGLQYTPILGFRDSGVARKVRQVARLMAPRMLGAAVVQMMFIANTIIASFYDASVLAALNYAWIVMLLPHGVFASSVATAIFPTFSRMAALGDRDGMRRAFARTLRAIFFVSLPATVGLVLLREPVVRLLFERGAFTRETTIAVSWALLFYAPGLVAHSLVEIINRAFFALQDTRTPVTVGVVSMVSNIVLSLLLIPLVTDPTSLTRGPQGALALANSIAATVEMVVLLWLLRRRLGGLRGGNLRQALLRTTLAAAAMGLLLGLFQRSSLAEMHVHIYVPLAIAGGAGVYLLAAWRLGIEEVRQLPSLLLRRG